MRSREYWMLRARQREHESCLRGEALNLKLFEEYRRAARSLRRQIGDFYLRYAGENVLSYEQAAAALNKRERQEWRKSVGEYLDEIKAAGDPQVKARLLSDYKARYYNSQITRLEALCGQINQTLNELYTRTAARMKAAYGEEFTESYYRKLYDLQQRAGYRNEFAKINAGMIENALSYPWKGANFSDRIWKAKEMLLYQLRETVTAGLIEGKGIAAMSRELSGKLGAGYRNAERVVRTETNHFHNEAEKAAYRAAGVEEYEFMAALSERTCAECGALDGRHFPLDGAKAGANYPPLHPNCRCTTVEYDPEDALDWLNSGVPMPERMTFEEWAEEQGIAPKGAGGVGQEKPHTAEYAGRVDFADKKAVYSKIEEFERLHRLDETESCLVATPAGGLYVVKGDASTVNTTEALGDKMRGSINTHNHPPGVTQYSFSIDEDVKSFFEDGSFEMRAFDEKYIYRMLRPEKLPDWREFRKVYADVIEEIRAEPERYGLDFETYEENYFHTVLEETCRRFQIACERWKR